VTRQGRGCSAGQLGRDYARMGAHIGGRGNRPDYSDKKRRGEWARSLEKGGGTWAFWGVSDRNKRRDHLNGHVTSSQGGGR